MGQWYDVGLQAGEKVAEAIDEFIAKEHKGEHDNFDPNKRKVLSNGSTVYQWYMKWEPSWYKDEQRFVEVLERFDDENLDDGADDDYYNDTAYKLVAVGDEGGEDERGNETGYDLFDGLYNACCVTYPDGWDDVFLGKSSEEVLSSRDENNYVEGYIRIHAGDLVDNDLESFLDQISEELVGSDLLMDIDYQVVGVEQDNMLVLKVTGDASNIIVDDEDEGGAA